jgi:DNA-binding IclR family transcriptional regulator
VLSGSEIAAELKLPRTNVLRLLSTLEDAGFIERKEGDVGYRIGLRAFEIGTLYLIGNPLSSILTGILDELVSKTQCTAYLGVLDGDDLVILNCREGPVPIQFIWKAGARLPCTTTAMGKAIMMHLPPEEITKHLGKDGSFRVLTERSLRTRSQLDAELAEFRQRGWSQTQEEAHAGVSAVGCAILDDNGYPIAAVSVCFFDHPPDPKRKEGYAKLVCDAAKNASTQIAELAVYGSRLTRESIF